jgi:NAD(P)-dependent dehydrogenase (short-subunit alcohol dehydrogenase family)
MPGDSTDSAQCNGIVERAMAEFGRIDIIVNNAAYQMTYGSLDEITDEEWNKTFDTNIGAMFRIVRSAVRHMSRAGRSSTPHRSTPTSPIPAYSPMQRQKAQSRTLQVVLRNFSPNRAYASIASRLGRSGHR